MKRYWRMILSGVAAGGFLRAETVISASTGLADESDVVLEKAVESVRSMPSDTAAFAGDAVSFAADEVRNSAHGIRAAFKGPEQRDQTAEQMLLQVGQAWDPSGKLQMRSFTIAQDVSREMMSTENSDAAVDVTDFFRGIDFPEGTCAQFWPEFNRLVVVQTPGRMLDVIDLLAVSHKQSADYRQVEIRTRFVEVEQRTLNELGFDWNFSDSWRLSGDWAAELADQTLSDSLRTSASAFGAGSPASMTLTKAGWLPLELVIQALEQSESAEVLSAPSLTTADGHSAEIRVGDGEQMPSRFEAGSANTSVFVEYSGWSKKNIGVNLQVTPKILEEEKISLELVPEVIDLVGYDTYEVTPANASMLVWAGQSSSAMTVLGRYPIPNVPGMDTAWNIINATLGGKDPNDPQTGVSYQVFGADPDTASNFNVQEANVVDGYFDQRRAIRHDEYGVPIPQINGSLPIFRVRRIETGLTVADGGTVGMGGLIYDKLETYKDKVPVLGSIPLLGRLFRSEGERSVKRNLMIFVTASRVDVHGVRAADRLQASAE